MDATIAVTGTTGALGGRIAAQLAAAGAHQVLIGRAPDRIPEWPRSERRGPAAYGDAAAMRRALEGSTTLVLVSGHLSGRRLEEHATAIDAALDVGVRRILYVSLLGAAPDATYLNARDHWQTEQYLAGVGVRHVILRPSFYSSMLPGLAIDGVIKGPASDGRVSAVAHDDIAEVAAALLLDHTGVEGVHAITGPEALTLADVADRLTGSSGKIYRYQHETPEEAFAWRKRLDASGRQIDGWISWYLAIAAGEVATVSDRVEHFTGHAARSLDTS